MTRRRRTRVRAAWLLVASFVLSLHLFGATASASCAEAQPVPEAIRTSPAVFVGIVESVENEDRWATVAVTEVWKGEVEQVVQVRGGPKDPPGKFGVITSVDTSYKVGKTYLFVPFKGSGAVFRDNACTSTTVYRPELARFRPASATGTPSPAEGPTDDAGPPEEGTSTWIFVGVGLAAVGLALAAARKLRAGSGE